MSRTADDDDEDATYGTDPVVDCINVDLLEMIGNTVKLSVQIAELTPRQANVVRARWNALVSAVNAVELPQGKKLVS
jgi:hypothetical protein